MEGKVKQSYNIVRWCPANRILRVSHMSWWALGYTGCIINCSQEWQTWQKVFKWKSKYGIIAMHINECKSWMFNNIRCGSCDCFRLSCSLVSRHNHTENYRTHRLPWQNNKLSDFEIRWTYELLFIILVIITLPSCKPFIIRYILDCLAYWMFYHMQSLIWKNKYLRNHQPENWIT